MRVIDELPDQLFGELMADRELLFRPVPKPAEQDQPDPTTSEVKIDARSVAEGLGLRIDYECPRQPVPRDGTVDVRHSDNFIQTLLFPEDLEAAMRKVSSLARTAIEESGSNMLYLAFGFLEWRDKDDEALTYLAPLLLIPVILRKKRLDPETKRFLYSISYSGEDLEANLSLIEKMDREFQLAFPRLEDVETPESYMSKVAKLVEAQRLWRVRRFITLSLFHFAKIVIYRDLDPARWPTGASPLQHPIIGSMFEGRHTSESNAESDGDLEHKAIHRPDFPLITNCDSSQATAIASAVAGHNIVIDGPPGTGKSQSIANLIAATLSSGKTVLFVSEKLAALEVVRQRLDEAGLGHFCLELHSHKTQRRALIDDISKRLQHQPKRDVQTRLQKAIGEQTRRVEQLGSHADRMVAPLGALGAPLVDWIWAAIRHVQSCTVPVDDLDRISVPTIDQATQEDIDTATNLASELAKAISRCCSRGSTLERHPWHGISRPDLTFLDNGEIKRILEHRVNSAHILCEAIEKFCALASVSIEPEYGVCRLAQVLLGIGTPTSPVVSSLVRRIHSDALLSEAQEFADAVSQAQALRNEIEKVFSSPSAGTIPDADRLEHLVPAGSIDELGKLTVSQIEDLSSRLVAIALEIQNISASWPTIAGLEDIDQTLYGLRVVLAIRNAASTASLRTFALRVPQMAQPEYAVALHDAERRAIDLLSMESDLAERFNLDLIQNAEELIVAARAFTVTNTFSVLSSSWRSARRLCQALSRGKPDLNLAASNFTRLHKWFTARTNFREDVEFAARLGTAFKGTETDFVLLRQAHEWVEATRRALLAIAGPTTEFASSVPFIGFDAFEKLLLRVPESIAQSAAWALSELDELNGELTAGIQTQPDDNLGAVAQLLMGRAQVLSTIVAAFDQFGARRHTQLRQLCYAARGLKSWLIRCRRIEDSPRGQELFGDHFQGANTDLSIVNSSIQWINQVRSADLPTSLKDLLVRGEDVTRERIAEASKSLVNHQTAFLESCAAWMNFAQVADAQWAGSSANIDLRLILHRDKNALESLALIEEMSIVCRATEALEKAELGSLAAIINKNHLDADGARIAFLAAFYRAAVRELFVRYPDVRGFDGQSQEAVRAAFCQAEEDLQELHRANLATKIAARSVPQGTGGARVSDFTDLALLRQQIQPNKRPLPIRRLLKQAGRALQALKPCFMMGPMSVAQFLDPAAMHFDLVIMDEASQLRPEDALGSIARSSQAVVVGDERQLPPTRFYQQQLGDDTPDGDDVLVATKAESILTLAKPVFRTQSLEWHYRSRHESLIAFSNHHFYDDRLVVFPSSSRQDTKLGVSFVFIEDSRYSNGRNPPEALRVARAAVDHILRNDGDTLGVVAMNYDQAELIESEIARLLRDNPQARRLEEQREGEAERWFAKNLENVQGDERDVIFISTTYGRSEAGGVSMQMGPITQMDGWRRLNVLFTRARKRVVVFAGMTDADMTVTPGGSRGVQALKDYLAFAREGKIFQPKFSKRPPDSDFEISVANALRAHGYECICQLGVANYFIDIAVVHPDQPGRYLVGIECDGRMYHSGKYARDRDRLRQMVLEGLGWQIHRIWSTDWFRNRDAAIARLVSVLQQARQADVDRRSREDRASIVDALPKPASAPIPHASAREPDERAAISAGNLGDAQETMFPDPSPPEADGFKGELITRLSMDEARRQLVHLRENTIKVECPDDDPAAGVLRKSMLEAFLRGLPTSIDEFRKIIPRELREKTDSKQLRNYGDRIFDVLARV